MARKPDIETIIAGCRKKDSVQQKAMYDWLSGKLFSICLRYSSDYADAEDMLQEGFVKIFTKLDKYNNSGSFAAWASRVVSNNCIDCIRKKPNLYTISDDYALNREAPNTSVLEKMAGEDILELIQSLPTGYRTIFNMYVIEGFSHKEIGEKLNISDGTSKSQLNRARNLLKKKLVELELSDLPRQSNA